MANLKITDLPAGTTLVGTELYESVQSATSVKLTSDQIKAFANSAPTLLVETSNTSTYGQCQFYVSYSNGTPQLQMTISNGSVAVAGALSKGSGSFKIDHPLPQLEATHHLVHSFIEGPQADLIYRGVATLVNGKASINIDSAAGMTEGTFEALCREVQCFTTNESDWVHVRGSVSGNILTIEAQDLTATSKISWMVVGERKDKHMLDTGWTDENGKVILDEKTGEPWQVFPNYAASVVLDWPLVKGSRDGVKVGGCGMNMCFHLVYTLSSILYGDGYALNHR